MLLKLFLFFNYLWITNSQHVQNQIQKHLRHMDNPHPSKHRSHPSQQGLAASSRSEPSSSQKDPTKVKIPEFFDRLHKRVEYQIPQLMKHHNKTMTETITRTSPTSDILQYSSQEIINYTQIILQSIKTHQYQSYDPYETNLREKLKNSKYYIYNLTEEFWWRWPKNGTQQSCIENGYLGHEHTELSAIGRPIIPDDGLFLTWHFSMFNSIFNRLKRSSRRTYNPDEATLFIIPYDIGLDGYLDPNTCRNRRQCSHGLVGKLTKFLTNSIYFQRNQGRDHVVLWSLGQYHPWPHAGCDLFMKDFCSQCTFTCYWMDPTKVDNKFISMPFPSAYHWWDNIKNIPWDLQNRHLRNLTAVYLGSTQTLNPAHTKIRRAMANQCNISSECHWLKISHSSIDNSIGDFLSIYKKAVFCLCPPGDDPARKAVFDAIVSGCIPVIFEVATLYNQYPWHIGEQAALDISVYIPGGLVRSNKIDLMNILLNIPPEVIYAKQIALAEVAPRVQYAIPPPSYLVDRYDETRWDPPFHDAVEIAVDGFFERSENLLNNRSTHIPHRLMSGREWGQEYDSVKIQKPKGPLKYGPISNGQKPKKARRHV